MRAGLSTIQQTLTPEAASVLNKSIAEAGRRNHGQTTPLHVAATLLSSPSGFLRQACIKSHPNSSHPLQCRALELCFSVALERLPTAQNLSPGHDPSISNALMAALKRAQAHQRRGCPEQQQQPLLAVKVELEQLIISILDDPSVSRVMREASFSSPAVKATIEQSLTSSSNSASSTGTIGLGFRASGPVPVPVPVPLPTPNRSLYVNPRLQQGSVAQSGQQRIDEVKRVVDILLRTTKRNPVLVGESMTGMVVKEVLKKIESSDCHGLLKNVQVIRLENDFLDRAQVPSKIVELGGLIEARIANSDCRGVILDLGDLKWLVEQPASFAGAGSVQQQVVSETGRATVAEMGKLLARFGEESCGGGGKVWLIGTATCETYLRCQVYHPSMENDWDLQALPIAARAPLPGMFSRLGTDGLHSSSAESLSPLKGFPTVITSSPRRLSENLDPAPRSSCCSQCMRNYEQELSQIVLNESEKSSSEAAKPSLPKWLKNAKPQDADLKTLDQTAVKDQDPIKQKSLELQNKWHDTCLRLHPSHYQPRVYSERIAQEGFSMANWNNLTVLRCQPFQPKLVLNRNHGGGLQLNPNLLPSEQTESTVTPPGSPVRTDLVLGRPRATETTAERGGHDDRTEDHLGFVTSGPQTKFLELQINKPLSTSEIDLYKKLLKGLKEKVWWQQDAASAVATTFTQNKLGKGKRRGAGPKGDLWLLFTGPDRVGKKKMASSLSELVRGAGPIIICLGSRRDDGESDVNFRCKTALDRIAEAVRRNPFSVILLEDIDEANMLVRGSIKRAMERGRLADSHGREVSLGNITFILTANSLPDNLHFLSKGVSLEEKKLASLASGGWQLRLSISEKSAKRRPNWLNDEERPAKPKRNLGSTVPFDLNEVADAGDDKADGSHNSSDLTFDLEGDRIPNNRLLVPTTASVSQELLNSVDDNIVFKPVDFGPLQRHVSNSIIMKFSTIVGDGVPLEIQDLALEKIVGGVWLGRTSIEEWTEKVLAPSLHQLKLRLPLSADESRVVCLESDTDDPGNRTEGDRLPNSIKLVVDGL